MGSRRRCCCSGTALHPCVPCMLPETNLTLSWTGHGPLPCPAAGSTTLVYMPAPTWTTHDAWIGPAGTGVDGCCNDPGFPSGTRIGVACNGTGTGLRIEWWIPGPPPSLICATNGPWTVVSCSPLHVSANSALGGTSTCDCTVFVNNTLYVLTA